MQIKDLHASVNGDDTVFTLPSDGLTILSDDGRPLFVVRLNKSDGSIILSSGGFTTYKNKLLDVSIAIKPLSKDQIALSRPVAED